MTAQSAHRIVAVSMVMVILIVALSQDWVTALRAGILAKTQGTS